MQQFIYLDIHHCVAPFDKKGRPKDRGTRHHFEFRSRRAAARAMRRRQQFSRWVGIGIWLIRKHLQRQAN